MLSQDIKTAELIYRVAAGSPEHGQNGFASEEECAALRRVIEAARKLPPIVTALKVADKINVDREGFDGPDGHAADGLPADHALTLEFRDEWRVIREAVESGEAAL